MDMDIPVLLSGSGKGGVGKSSVACGVAISALRHGLHPALIDVDIRAPNLGYMLGVDTSGNMANVTLGEKARPNPVPVQVNGSTVPFFTPAFLFPDGGAVLMGGGAMRALTHDLLHAVNWPPIDLVVVDMDPAPGDTLRTVSQYMHRVYGLIVTTAERWSIEDARRMANAYNNLGVKNAGMVGNMTGIVEGDTATIANEAVSLSVPYLGSLPWDVEFRKNPIGAFTGDNDTARKSMRVMDNIIEAVLRGERR